MALHLITGRANAGKSGLVNERLSQALSRGEAPVLVVPTLADARRSTGELTEKFPVGVRVATWNTWLEELWRLHGDGRRMVEEPTRVAFLSRAVSEASTPGIDRAKNSRGFSAILSRLVAQMPASALPRMSTGPFDMGVRAICRRYADLVDKAALIEPALACEVLSSSPPPRIGPVVMSRFDVLQHVQTQLVRSLSRTTDVTVALTWEKGFAPTRAVDQAIQELEESVSTWERVGEAAPSNELDQLLRVLYSTEQNVAATGAVRLGMAGGAEAEAELAAREIAGALERGIRPDRIALAFPDLGSVAHHVATALRSRGVAFEMDMVRPVIRSALGSSFAAVLELASGVGDRTTALALLLGPHCDVPSEEVERIDRRWRTNRVFDPHRILQDLMDAGEYDTIRAVTAVQAVGGERLTAEAAKRLARAIDHLIAARAARDRRTELDPSTRASGLREDAAASRALLRAIAGMASVPGAPFKLADVRQSLPSIRAGGTSGEGAEFVQVTELGRLRSRRFDTVIVGGLTAAESPVCGLDSLYDELAAALGIAHGPEPEALARLHFYLAISRARRELVLIRKEETSEGAALRPSVLWEEILDAYRVPGDEPDSWPRGAPEPTRVRAEDVVEFAPVFTKGRREARAETALDPHGCASVPRGMVRDRQALEGFSAKDTYSVSEIEVYLQCPYRWFYERVVRPGEIDAALDARAVGSLAHGLLKRFYDAWNREAESLRVTPETVDLARRIFARVSASAGSEHGAQGLADDLAVARGVRWAANIIEDDARVLPGFAPAAHELSFGDEGSEFNFGGVKFRGRIDRVDVSDTALFVTDYKSSRDLVALARLESEGRIQAVVYAEATRRLMGDLPVAGSVYRSFRTHAMRGFWRPDLLGGVLNRGDEADVIDSEGYAALVEATEERVALAVEGIRAGDISRSRASRNACVFCVLAPQCEQAAT